MYIYQNENWPHFIWDKPKVLARLAQVKLAQGLLLGKMQNIGFAMQDSALLQTLTEEILKSNQIEGQLLDIAQVRSSIARRLGLPNEDIPVDRKVDGTVEMMLDAIQHYNAPVNKARLCAWHKHMFPDGKSGFYTIQHQTHEALVSALPSYLPQDTACEVLLAPSERALVLCHCSIPCLDPPI